MADLNALYEQYLGRAPDPSGIATWSGQDEASIIAGIMGSQEYANRQSSGGGGDSGGGGGVSPSTATDINALYQQYLGRNVDPTGAATWAGQSPEAIIAGITGSPEYQARQGGGGGNAQNLANQVFNLYATNQNYDQQLNQLNALAATDPKAFYEARIGLLGKQMGWQIGQNTGDRNSVYQAELNSLIPGALASGMTQDQINNLIGQNTAAASQQNQARIAADAASGAGSGWVNQNIPGGWATVGALGAGAIAAPYLLGALGAGEAGALTTGEILSSTGFVPTAGGSFTLPSAAAAAGAIGQALPYTEAYDAWNLAQQGLGASDIAQNLAATGMDSFLAADVGNLAAQGLSEAQIAQVIGASYTPTELAGTAFESAGWGPASSALSAADILKGLGASAKGLTGSGLSSALRQGAASGLAPSLGKLAQGQVGMGMEIPGIVRTNTNPFYNTPQQPIQNPQKTEMSSLADILRQGKSSWQT